MCMVDTPKISKSDAAAKEKDPAIIRNPYLDGVNDFKLNRAGRSQLRIDPGSTRQPAAPLPPSAPVRFTPTPRSTAGMDGWSRLVHFARDRAGQGR